LCSTDSYYKVIIIIIIIIITLFVTYVRLYGDWKVRFEVLLELNAMVVFRPKPVDLTTNKNECCAPRWFLFPVNDDCFFFGSDIVQLLGSVILYDDDSFISGLICTLKIIVVIIFLETEDTSELFSVLPRKRGLVNMLLPPFGHILST